MDDLSVLLDCPVCMETIYPPIYQCPNGHLLCSNCKPLVNNTCPTCRESMGTIRALALEQMIAPTQLPCRYRATGCTGIYRYDSKPKHEQQCKFRPFSCPYPCEPCQVTGNLETMVEHLQHDHGSVLRRNSIIEEVFNHCYPYSGENFTPNIFIYTFDGKYFCLHFTAFPSPLDMVYMAFLTFMGDDEDALKFGCSLELQSDNRQMIWRGTPRSIREGADQIRESLDGLVIHQSVAQLFAEINTEDELALGVKGQIWKEDF